MTERIALVVLAILGLALLISIVGIIWLASANPARSIPDVLVGTPGTIIALIAGILIPNRPTTST